MKGDSGGTSSATVRTQSKFPVHHDYSYPMVTASQMAKPRVKGYIQPTTRPRKNTWPNAVHTETGSAFYTKGEQKRVRIF